MAWSRDGDVWEGWGRVWREAEAELGRVREPTAYALGGRAGRRGVKPRGGNLEGVVAVTLERATSSQVQVHGHEEK